MNAALPCWKVRRIANDDVAWDIVIKAFTHGPTRAFSSIGTKAMHDWSLSLCSLSGAHNVSSITFRVFCPCTWKLVVHWPSQRRLTISSAHPWTLLGFWNLAIHLLKSRLLLPMLTLSRNSWLPVWSTNTELDFWYSGRPECQEIHVHVYQSNVENP